MTLSRKWHIVALMVMSLSVISASGQITQKKAQDTLTDQQRIALDRQIFWDHLPKPLLWVNDYEGLFTDEEIDSLNKIINDFEISTGIEIAIITIDTLLVSKEAFDDLISHFANTWGVGKKYKDNGITIGISSGYRRMRISNGLQMENILSDAKTKEIIDNYFIPKYKEGEHYQGTLTGLTEIIKFLRTTFEK